MWQNADGWNQHEQSLSNEHDALYTPNIIQQEEEKNFQINCSQAHFTLIHHENPDNLLSEQT